MRIYIRDQNDAVLDVLDDTYYDLSIEDFLKGKATVLSFSMVKDEMSYELITTGKNLSFVYDNEEYWLTCMIVEQDEYYLSVTAWSIGLEYNNETIGPYKSPKAMTFVEYLNVIDFEKVLTIGINEVSDKKISYEWTGTDKKLARLYSLANVFGAEIAFVTRLNDDGSLKQIVINVYHEHDDDFQGVGNDRRNETFYFGEEIKTIKKTEDKTGLYTAITATGKDGLTIAAIDREVKDENGLVLYKTVSKATADYPDVNKIYAVQARLQFPSTVKSNDRWTVNDAGETEYSSAEALYGYMLSQLKENSIPKVTWEIEGNIKAKIGDTVRIADEGYKPTLYLEARVTGKVRKPDDLEQETTTFSNVKELQSQVDQSLLDRVNVLIERTKPYTLSIVSDNGVTFKNSEGKTTLSAIVYNGTQVITPDVTVRWYKDDVWVKTGYTLEVKASDINAKAVYKAIVIDTNGKERATQDVTVFNVDDGRGIKGKPVLSYASSGSINTVPSTWQATIPSVPAGSYLWTREVTTYSDNTTSEVITPVLQGPKGDSGTDGIAGKDGIGIKSTQIMYAGSDSGTVKPTAGWTADIPVLAAGKYLWTETTWLYSDNTGEAGYSVSRIGKDGNTGADGIAGKDGVGLKSTTINYAASTSGTVKPINGWSTTIPSVPEGSYLWTRTVWTYTDSTSETGYSVAMMGRTGADGVAGKDGVGLRSTEITYAASTSGTAAPSSGYTSSVPTVPKGSYLWTKTVWTYTDNSTETGYSVAYMGTNGNNGTNGVAGKDGVGIANTTITYASSTSGTIAPASGYTPSVPSVAEGSYLWTKTVWTYTDKTIETGYSVAKQGAKGADGKDGKSITDSKQEWAASMSGTTAPTNWQTAIPTVSAGQYLWSKVTETWSDNTHTYLFTIGKIGENGQNAQMMFLSADKNTMMFNADNTAKFAQTATITAKYQNVSGTVAFTAKGIKANGTSESLTLTGTGDSRIITSAMFKTDWVMITVTATLAGLTDTLSIIKVNDGAQGIGGATGYFHSAWAMSADGKTGFSTTVSEGKWYIGTYFDFVEADSTDPARYNWLELAGAVNMYISYAWSQDGKDRFTRVKPVEVFKTEMWTNGKKTYIGDTDFITITVKPFTNYTASTGYDSMGDWSNIFLIASGQSASSPANGVNKGTDRTITTKADGLLLIGFRNNAEKGINVDYNMSIYEGTIAYANSEFDYDNAVPRYIGRSLKDSNSPSDYKWEPNPERKPWTVYAQDVNGKDFSLMPYGAQLIPRSNTLNTAGSVIDNCTISSDAFNGHVVMETVLNWNGVKYYPNNFTQPIQVGVTYIYSCWFRIKNSDFLGSINLRFYGEYTDSHGIIVQDKLSYDDGWVRLYKVFKYTQSGTDQTIRIEPRNITGSGAILQFAEPKLELANTMEIPTPWTPAPSEDPLSAIPKYVGTAALPYEDPYKYEWDLNPAWLQQESNNNLANKVDNNTYNNDQSTVWTEISNRVTGEEAKKIETSLTNVTNAYTDFVSTGGKHDQDLANLKSAINTDIQKLADKVLGYDFVNTWFRIGDGGLSIGEANSNFEILVSNDQITFYDSGTAVAYVSNQSFFINSGMIVDDLQIGKFKFAKVNDNLMGLFHIA